jgi:hypothetical protein
MKHTSFMKHTATATPTLYLSPNADGQPLLALPHTAETLSTCIHALEQAETWADFRRLMPADELKRLQGLMRDDGARMPDGDKPFDADLLPGFADGDWPALITSTMLREVPEPVLKAFGDRGPSALNGDLVQFDADQLPAIKAMLTDLGWTVVERPDLRMDVEG